jgi:hypothetical protein
VGGERIRSDAPPERVRTKTGARRAARLWFDAMRTASRAAILLVALLAASCASLEFERTTPTSGTFTSTAVSVTIFSVDLPGSALGIARGNAADARQPNSLVVQERVFPYLGPLDWLLDIVSVRWARVSGTWGVPPEMDESAAQE